jgi:hypothetical protein
MGIRVFMDHSGRLVRPGRPLPAGLEASEVEPRRPEELRALIAAEPAERALWLDVDPGHHAKLIPLLSSGGRELLVSAPLATSEQELAGLQRELEPASRHLRVAHALLSDASFVAARKRVREREAGRVFSGTLELFVAMPGTLQRAMEQSAHHDALAATLEGAFALLRDLGLPVDEAQVAVPVDADYWKRLVVTARSGDVSWNITVKPVASPPELARLRVECEQGPLGGRAAGPVAKVVEALSASPWPEPVCLDEAAADARLSMVLVDAYLYGKARELQRFATDQMLAQVSAEQSPFKAFGRIGIGARFGTLYAKEGAGQEFMAPLDRPFRLLLVRVPCFNRWRLSFCFPPLALAQMNAFVSRFNVETTLVDLLPDQDPLPRPGEFSEREIAQLTDIDRLAGLLQSRMGEGSYDLVGFSMEDPDALFVVEQLIPRIRSRVGATVLGGRGVSALDKKRLTEGRLVDYLITGEGELPLLGLIKHLRGEAPYERVPGLWRTTLPSWNPQTVHEMSLIPTPDFGNLDMSVYESGKYGIPSPFLPYLFILGCPYRCAFCGNDAGQKARMRPLEMVVDDLRTLRDRHGITNFYFLNNMINTNPRYARAFTEAMRKADLGIRWCDCARPAMITSEDLHGLAQVGCAELTWGVDTASQRLARILDMAGKVEVAKEVIKTSASLGIRNTINLIVGMPQENEDDFLRTVEFAHEMAPYAGFCLNAYNYNSGSPVFENPAEFGLRRRGETFAEVGGGSWEEHVEAVERRMKLLRDICPTEPPQDRGRPLFPRSRGPSYPGVAPSEDGPNFAICE